ncbi:MAG TPA: hypothetical protein VKE40_21765 [Gemmataceae bacterium]|nr:hypothetical protein [Gemmataceae bacterium]
MSDESIPDFTGKVLAVQLATPPMSIALEQARYERQFGKLYLIGRQVGYPDYPNWADGATYYIAPEQISFFAVFDSLETFLARAAAAWKSAPPVDPHPQRRSWFGRRG